MTRVLVLDLWGTLVATPDASGHRAALTHVANRLDLDVSVFADAYEARRLQRDTGSWTRENSSGRPSQFVYLKRLVTQSFPTRLGDWSDADLLEASQHLFDDTRDALADDRLVPGVIASLQESRDKGSVTILCSDAGPWMRDALEGTALYDLFDGIVISAETGFRKPAPEMYDAASALAEPVLQLRQAIGIPQYVFIGDGGSQDPDRTTDEGYPYSELHGAYDAEFDSVLQVDHFHEVDSALVYERRPLGWPDMLSFHDVPTALFALNARR